MAHHPPKLLHSGNTTPCTALALPWRGPGVAARKTSLLQAARRAESPSLSHKTNLVPTMAAFW
jgi:hypothetical protein